MSPQKIAVCKSIEIVRKIKDELRNLVSSWNYELTHDRSMNLQMQRKVENAVEKAMILQKIRLKHVERSIAIYETSDAVGKSEMAKELQTYWNAILPELITALTLFKEISESRKVAHNIDNLEIPSVLDLSHVFPVSNVKKSMSKNEKTVVHTSDVEKLRESRIDGRPGSAK